MPDKMGTGHENIQQNRENRIHTGTNHAKRREHATIGCGNILKLRNDNDWNTIEAVETISLNSMNHHFLA